MTQTMRERLYELLNSNSAENFRASDLLDEILDMLATPDADMREAGLGAVPDCDVQSSIHRKEHAAFVAMIEAVRKQQNPTWCVHGTYHPRPCALCQGEIDGLR